MLIITTSIAVAVVLVFLAGRASVPAGLGSPPPGGKKRTARAYTDGAREVFARGPRPHTFWRHRKGGLYRVVGCALVEETAEPVVVYVPAEPTDGSDVAWTRPLGEFLDRFSPHRGRGEAA